MDNSTVYRPVRPARPAQPSDVPAPGTTSGITSVPAPGTAGTAGTAPAGAPVRYGFLDALRGVALCGILFVNLRDLLSDRIEDLDHPVQRIYDLGVQGRFVPVFAFLFGVSAWLLYSSSLRRLPVRGARLLMVRRFVFLLPVGLLNLLVLYRGDILTMYSVFALVLLVPALFLPRGPVLGAGIVATVVAYQLYGNSPLIAASLMLTGFGAAQFGLPARLESGTARTRAVTAVVFAASAAAAVGLTVTQAGVLLSGEVADTPSYDRTDGVAGLTVAVALVTGLSLVWGTRAGRGVLDRVFTPLGRTALTNYLGASALVQVGLLLVPGQLDNLWLLPVITVAVLLVQRWCSMLWLRWFRYGPVEWVWRTATRWEKVPMRRTVPQARHRKA